MRGSEFLQFFGDLGPVNRGFATVGILLGVYLVYRIVGFYLHRLVTDTIHRQRYHKIARNLHLLISFALIVGVWTEELKTVTLLLTGVLAASLIAGKEMLLGLAARFHIAIVDPYEIGDRILINGICGDVVKIGLLYTWVMEIGGAGERQSTGRLAIIPHFWLTQHALLNYTQLQDFLWEELEFNLSGKVDVPRVMALIGDEAKIYLKETIERPSRTFREIDPEMVVKRAPVIPVVYARLEHHGDGRQYIVLTLRFVAPARQRVEIRSNLSLRILSLLEAHGVTLLGLPAAEEPEADAGADRKEQLRSG